MHLFVCLFRQATEIPTNVPALRWHGERGQTAGREETRERRRRCEQQRDHDTSERRAELSEDKLPDRESHSAGRQSEQDGPSPPAPVW